MLNHEFSVDRKLQHVLALHCLHHAVRDAVGQNHLQVLVLEVVLEVVVVLVGRDEAPVELGANVEEEREVELFVVDVGVSSHPPVQIEVTRLVELLKLHGELVNLVIEGLLRDRVEVLVDHARAKHVVGALDDVLAQVEKLAVPPSLKRFVRKQDGIFNVYLKVVQVAVKVTVCGGEELSSRDSTSVSEVKLHVALFLEQYFENVVKGNTPVVHDRQFHVHHSSVIDNHASEVKSGLFEVKLERVVMKIGVKDISVDWERIHFVDALLRDLQVEVHVGLSILQ